MIYVFSVSGGKKITKVRSCRVLASNIQCLDMHLTFKVIFWGKTKLTDTVYTSYMLQKYRNLRHSQIA